jgi:rhodanese-related sulfurtransferase
MVGFSCLITVALSQLVDRNNEAKQGAGSTMEFEISAGQLKSLQKTGEPFLLLDVREPWEFETAKIEGAKNIPMGDIPTRANQELDPDAHIVVVCHHGVRSLTVTNWLRQQGFEKVQSMRGGIDGWARTVDPKVPLY